MISHGIYFLWHLSLEAEFVSLSYGDSIFFRIRSCLHFHLMYDSLKTFNVVLEAVSCTTQVESVNIHYYSGSSESACFHILCITTPSNFWSRNSVIAFNYHTYILIYYVVTHRFYAINFDVS